MTELVPREGEVLFVPVSGCNEIGRNLTLYGHDGAWIAVDCGIGFPPANLQGTVDAILPNPEFLYRNAANIRALVITHAHEDHLGAIPYLWGEQLTCPVFAPPFAARLLQKKWHRMGEFFNAFEGARPPLALRTYETGERFALPPFHITALPVAHSVPDSCALCIETSCGVVLHSGDWKLDANPVIGAPRSENLFDAAENIGKKQHLPFVAMMGDSTNMFSEGASGDEASTQPAFENLFRKPYRRIVVTLFASNIARIISVARAAKACGRRVSIAGSALHRLTEIARDGNLLQELGQDITLESLNARLPAEQTVLLATGSQGEIGSFMHRLAHGNGFLTRGDVAVFSSRTIPGNEVAVGKVKNALTKKGVKIIDHHTLPALHVSGHATGEEAERVYRRLRPQWFVPIHGEPRHLQENARRAEKVGLKTRIVYNGQGLRFARSAKGVLCEPLATPLPAEEQYLERSNDLPRWLPQSDRGIKERSKLSENGACACILTLDEENAEVSEVHFLAFGDHKLEALLERQGRSLLRDALEAVEARTERHSEKRWERRGKRTPSVTNAPDDGDASSKDRSLARAFAKQIAKATGRRPLVKMLVKRR